MKNEKKGDDGQTESASRAEMVQSGGVHGLLFWVGTHPSLALMQS
jgi:hypothetical protein